MRVSLIEIRHTNISCIDLCVKIRVSDWPPLLRALSTAKKIQKLRFTSTWRSGRPTPIVHQDNSTIQKQIVQSLKHLLSKKNDLREFAIEQIQLYVPTCKYFSRFDTADNTHVK